MKVVSDRKQLNVDEEFILICEEIESENKSDEEWSAIESSDMFQTSRYNGGYDSTEQEFCFSFYDSNEREWWFQLSLPQVRLVTERQLMYLDLSEPH